MPVFADGSRSVSVVVFRVDGLRASFRWQLQEYDRAIPLERGDEIYTSEREARLAGQRALAKRQTAAVPSPA